MQNLKSILDQIEFFWQRRSTFKALIVFVFITNAFYSASISGLYFILNKFNSFNEVTNFRNFVFIIITAWGFLNIIVVLVWMYWRRVPKIPRTKVGIIFAPHSDPDCTNLIYKLYDQFKLDLKKRNFDSILTHRLLPQNKIVKRHDQAKQLLDSTEARLIVHGYVNQGKINDENVEGFKTISFTLRHRTLWEIEKKPVLGALAGALAYRTFTAREKNSFFEKNIVIENISEVACFFISIGLTLEGKLEESLKILYQLLEDIKPKIKNPILKPRIQQFYNSIISNLTVNLHASYKHVYLNYLIENITLTTHNKYADECMLFLNKLVEINRKTSDYYLQKSIILFHFGKIDDALECVKKAKRFAPENSPGPHFSFAFLYLWKGEFKKSLREYKRAERCMGFNIEFILDIILFLQNLYKNKPEKIQILYALSFVNEKFYDSVRALEDYKKFLELSEDKSEFNELRIFARKRIDYLESFIE